MAQLSGVELSQYSGKGIAGKGVEAGLHRWATDCGAVDLNPQRQDLMTA
jgi:hypothetical protein